MMRNWKWLLCFLPLLILISGCKNLDFADTPQVLRIYSELPQGITEDFVKDFLNLKENKVKLEVVYPPKKPENSNLNIVQNGYDIWLGATVEEYFDADNKKLLSNYQGNDLRTPAVFRDRNGAWTSLFTTNLVLVVNKKVLNNQDLLSPKSWFVLQDPAWQNKLVISDPIEQQGGYRFISMLWQLQGEKWLDIYLGNLRQRQVSFVKTDEEALRLVDSGEKAATVVTLEIAMQAALKNSSLSIIVPTEGTSRKVTGVAIMASTKQEAWSRQFVDYLLSERAKNILDKSDYYAWSLAEGANNYTWGQPYAETFFVQDDVRWSSLSTGEIVRKGQMLILPPINPKEGF